MSKWKISYFENDVKVRESEEFTDFDTANKAGQYWVSGSPNTRRYKLKGESGLIDNKTN